MDSPFQAPRGSAEGAVAIIGIGALPRRRRRRRVLAEPLRRRRVGHPLLRRGARRRRGVDPALVADPRYVKARAVLDGVELFDAALLRHQPARGGDHRSAAPPVPRVRVGGARGRRLRSRRATRARSASSPARASSGYLLHHVLPSRGARRSPSGLGAMLGNDKDYLATRVAYKLNLTRPEHHRADGLLDLAGRRAPRLPEPARRRVRHGARRRRLDRASREHRATSTRRAASSRRTATAAPSTPTRRAPSFGNGAGVVVLKRLADALADGDTIHAVIRGSAVNNDGVAQGRLHRAERRRPGGGRSPRRYAVAGVDARHHRLRRGARHRHAARRSRSRSPRSRRRSAPPPSETRLLRDRLGQDEHRAPRRRRRRRRPHQGGARARARGRSRRACTSTRRTPRSTSTPARSSSTPSCAPGPPGETPRRAGVSSFGIGGTNAHVVLEEAPAAAGRDGRGSAARSSSSLSARTPAALDAATASLAAHLERHPATPTLADVAYTLQVGRRAFEHRRALVCSDRAEAVAALAAREPARVVTRAADEPPAPRSRSCSPARARSTPAWRASSTRTEPVFRARRRPVRGAARAAPRARPARAALLGARPAAAASGSQQTALAQPALFAVEYALARLWMAWGVRPRAMIGHSIGEYVAACLAGVFSLEDALALVAARGRLMQALPAGRDARRAARRGGLALLRRGAALARGRQRAGVVRRRRARRTRSTRSKRRLAG